MVDEKLQTPKDMSVIIVDVIRSYTGNLLSKTDKKRYTRVPGPADQSGMHIITDIGRIGEANWVLYVRE